VLLDHSHPNAAYYQHVLRDALRGSSSHQRVLNQSSQGRFAHGGATLPEMVVGTRWERQTLFSPSELESYLSTPFRALALVTRAGVKRRDIIDLQPQFPKPAGQETS
jgi:hypothetical protein